MSGISCHVLDTALGRPAAGVRVQLERLTPGAAGSADTWQVLGQALTNADGRVPALEGAAGRELGRHRIRFDTGDYFQRTGQAIFYPTVQVEFMVGSPSDNYHVPLLLSPFGYSTYRGS